MLSWESLFFSLDVTKTTMETHFPKAWIWCFPGLWTANNRVNSFTYLRLLPAAHITAPSGVGQSVFHQFLFFIWRFCNMFWHNCSWIFAWDVGVVGCFPTFVWQRFHDKSASDNFDGCWRKLWDSAGFCRAATRSLCGFSLPAGPSTGEVSLCLKHLG